MKRASFLLLLCAAVPAGATAERPLKATLTEMTGDVQTQTKDGAAWEPAEPGVVLAADARLKTGAGASADLIFDDGTAVHAGENASLSVETAREDGTGREFSLRLWAGRVLSQVLKREGSPARYRIRTPVAVAAVRGTEFVADASEGGTQLAVFEGEIETQSLRDDAPLGDAVSVKPEQEISLAAGRPAGRPRALSRTMKNYRKATAALFRNRIDGYRRDMSRVQRLQQGLMERRRRLIEEKMEERRKGDANTMEDYRRQMRRRMQRRD